MILKKMSKIGQPIWSQVGSSANSWRTISIVTLSCCTNGYQAHFLFITVCSTWNWNGKSLINKDLIIHESYIMIYQYFDFTNSINLKHIFCVKLEKKRITNSSISIIRNFIITCYYTYSCLKIEVIYLSFVTLYHDGFPKFPIIT